MSGTSPARSPPLRRRRGRRRSTRRAGRGVSELVGTLLVLGITLVLATTVFLWVQSSPPPRPAVANNFQVSLTSSGSKLTGIGIRLLTGPPIAGAKAQSYIQLRSQHVPGAFPSTFSLSSGLGGQTVWQSGQSWALNLTSYGLPSYDNLTVLIEAGGTLAYLGVSPQQSFYALPYFNLAGVSPSAPSVSTSFQVFCNVSAPMGLALANPVTANFTTVPGLSSHGQQPLTYIASSGVWSYTASSGASSTGTYVILFTVTDKLGHHGYQAVAFTVH